MDSTVLDPLAEPVPDDAGLGLLEPEAGDEVPIGDGGPIDDGGIYVGDEGLTGDVVDLGDGSSGDMGLFDEETYIIDEVISDDGGFTFDGDPLPDEIDLIDWEPIDLEIIVSGDGGADDGGVDQPPSGDDATAGMTGDPPDIDILSDVFVFFPIDLIA